jgi:hypothetical protein
MAPLAGGLVAFLQDRLDETARKAEAAKPGPWHADGENVYASHPTDEVVGYTESAEHIAENDPRRVLAEVDAKRRIIVLYDQAATDTGSSDYLVAGPARLLLVALDPVLHLLALPYAGHPDYRPEWAPDA